MASSLMEFLALRTGPHIPLFVALLCVVYQPAIFDLPTKVDYWPGEGPMVRSRYNSLDILFKVLKWPVPPHPGQEVHWGCFL